MEAWDSGSKIRPLPIDDIDGDAPQHHPIEPRRRLAPLIVIVAGALAFGVIARGLGVSETADGNTAPTTPPAAIAAEPGPTTTTTAPAPPPPTLRQLLPVAVTGIDLVTVTASTSQIGHWAPDSVEPTFRSNVAQPRTVTYNADGTRVAIHTWVRDGSFVIDSAGTNAIHLRDDITSGAWHPTDPDLFAWTVRSTADSAAETTIRVADLSGDTSSAVQPLVEFSVPQGNHRLEAWGDWGFATSTDNTTFGFDPDGIETRMSDGVYFDVAGDGTLLLATIDDQGAVPFLLGLEGSETPLPSIDIGASDFDLTTDGEWVLAITSQEDGHTSILARTVHSRSTRLTSVHEPARVVGNAWGDRFLVLQEVHTNDVVFKDWNTGAEYRIPAGDQVAGLYLEDATG